MSNDDKVIELRSSFNIGVASVSDDRLPHILICIHGIRDDNAWCNQTRTAAGKFLDTTIEVACVRYDRLSSFGLILKRDRTAAQESVLNDINFIASKNPDSPISMLCHSNGTKIIAEILPRIKFNVEWVFLCASLCHLKDVPALRKSKNTVSDASTKDWWPIWAEALRPSIFQATGVTGFNYYPIIDRSFPYGHGDGVNNEHIEKWIFPTISTGKVISHETADVGFKKHAAVYIRRTIFSALAAALACAFYKIFF